MKKVLPALSLAILLIGAGCATNHAPVARAGPDQIVPTGATVTLDGSASRAPYGKPLTFSWQQTLGPPVSLSSTSAPIVTLTAPSNGTTLIFKLTVSDGKKDSAAKVSISVRPVDQSAQVVEVHQRPVTEDPAVSGNLDPGWRRARHPKTPPQPPDVDRAEGAFQDLNAVKFAPPIEVPLSPGSTRQVELEVAGPSVLLGSVRWDGTANALPVILSFNGSQVAAGDAYRLGTNRGGTSLTARTTASGRATLSVTNTSGAGITVKVTLGALPR